MTRFIIKQLVKNVKRNDIIIVDEFQADYERNARWQFAQYKKEFPGEYFELVKVVHSEECLDFTPILNEKPAT